MTISKACSVHVYAMCIHRCCLSWESCTSSRGGETSCNRWWLQSFTKEASNGPVTVTTQHTLSTLYYFIHVVAIVDVTGCTPCFSNVPHVVSFAFGKIIIHTYVNIWHVTIVCVCVCVCACVHACGMCAHTHMGLCSCVCNKFVHDLKNYTHYSKNGRHSGCTGYCTHLSLVPSQQSMNHISL